MGNCKVPFFRPEWIVFVPDLERFKQTDRRRQDLHASWYNLPWTLHEIRFIGLGEAFINSNCSFFSVESKANMHRQKSYLKVKIIKLMRQP